MWPAESPQSRSEDKASLPPATPKVLRSVTVREGVYLYISIMEGVCMYICVCIKKEYICMYMYVYEHTCIYM